MPVRIHYRFSAYIIGMFCVSCHPLYWGSTAGDLFLPGLPKNPPLLQQGMRLWDEVQHDAISDLSVFFGAIDGRQEVSGYAQGARTEAAI